MAVAFLMDFERMRAEDYDWIDERMELVGRLPPGALFHVAGPADDGWRIYDVWESAEAFQAFADAKIGPISAERGMSPPRVRSFPVNELRRGGKTGPVAFAQVVVIPGLDADGFLAFDREVLGAERRVPADCVFHVNGGLDGDWCVMDVWTSKEVRDRFAEEQIRPAVQARGLTVVPTFEEVVVHNALTEPARATSPA
jgi:hypothetical protein